MKALSQLPLDETIWLPFASRAGQSRRLFFASHVVKLWPKLLRLLRLRLLRKAAVSAMAFRLLGDRGIPCDIDATSTQDASLDRRCNTGKGRKRSGPLSNTQRAKGGWVPAITCRVISPTRVATFYGRCARARAAYSRTALSDLLAKAGTDRTRKPGSPNNLTGVPLMPTMC